MIGYVFDYCLSRGYEPIVYSTIDNLGWIEFYRKMYPHFNLRNPNSFNPGDCDRCFLLTDDDFTFHDSSFLDNSDKILSIEHSSDRRRFSAKLYCGTRYFPNRPIPYCLPTFPIFSLEAKRQAILEREKIIITILGKNIPISSNQLSNLFLNFADLEFNCISRMNCYFQNGIHLAPNVAYFSDLSTIDMIKILLISDYILCLENYVDHVDKAISASIPLSFGVLCRLIIPKSWNCHYNLSSSLEYGEEKIKLEKEIDLQAIEKERQELIEHRNTLFDSFVNIASI